MKKIAENILDELPVELKIREEYFSIVEVIIFLFITGLWIGMLVGTAILKESYFTGFALSMLVGMALLIIPVNFFLQWRQFSIKYDVTSNEKLLVSFVEKFFKKRHYLQLRSPFSSIDFVNVMVLLKVLMSIPLTWYFRGTAYVQITDGISIYLLIYGLVEVCYLYKIQGIVKRISKDVI